MPRAPRIMVEGAIYVVTSQGLPSELTWKDAQDYQTYLELLAAYQAKYGFTLFAYCLLPDQALLCVAPRAGTTLSAIMHDLTTRYTKYFNKRYGRTGHLFQQRFQEALVERSAEALLPVTAYLHTQAVRSGLVSEAGAYPFSSYPRYRNVETARDLLSMEEAIREIISLLPESKTIEAYERYVSEFSMGRAEAIRVGLRQHVIGSEAFALTIKERAANSQKPAIDESPLPAQTQEVHATAVHTPAWPWLIGSVAVLLVIAAILIMPMRRRINTLEQMLLALSQEREAEFRTRPSLATFQSSILNDTGGLDGTAWEIRLMPTNRTTQNAMDLQLDQLTFANSRVVSKRFSAQGVPDSNYTLMKNVDGSGVWETVQTTAGGDLLTWKGVWRGRTMQGFVTRQSTHQAIESFTFVGILPQPSNL